MSSTGTAVPLHIVWDWNGTLLDDNHAVVVAVNQVCARFGRPPVSLEYWRSVFRRPLTACYEELLERTLNPQDWAILDGLYHQSYRAVLHTCRLAEGASVGLRRWRDLGGSQSLLSMWFHRELVSLVTELGLAGYFSRMDGLRRTPGGDSKAAHLTDHLAAQALDPRRVVVIGDVADDAIAAEHVGARSVLVSTGMMSRKTLQWTGVPVTDSIAEALDLITE